MSNKLFYFLIIGSLFLFSCEDTETTPELTIPVAYDGSSFETNAATELTVRTELSNLRNEIFKGRTGEQVSEATALAALNQVLPVTTNYYSELVTSSYVPNLIAISGGQRAVLGTNGGVYGAYLLSKDGIEYEQLIEKGLFGAALYNHAVSLLNGPITAATSDQVLAAFGANPSFPSSNNGSLHQDPDGWMATYAARRDKNDGQGLYTQMQNELIKLQAAANAGSGFVTEQNEAAAAILTTWEKANAATVINYLHAVISKLSATSIDENAQASAMHSFSEAVGFLHGFKSISSKSITDAQIDATLALMNVPVGQEPQTLLILSQPATELPKLVQAIANLQNIYGFTDQDIEDFKKNWISEQNR